MVDKKDKEVEIFNGEIARICRSFKPEHSPHFIVEELNKVFPDYVFIAYRRDVLLPHRKKR